MCQKKGGFTLIELLVGVAIFAVLASLAVPSIATVLENQKINSVVNDLYRSIRIARSEAITRNRPVTLCRSNDGVNCGAGTTWADGWIIFTDDPNTQDRNNVLNTDNNETLIRRYPAVTGVTINANLGIAGDNDPTKIYSSTGRSGAGNFGVTSGDRKKEIIFVLSGRPRITSFCKTSQNRCPAP